VRGKALGAISEGQVCAAEEGRPRYLPKFAGSEWLWKYRNWPDRRSGNSASKNGQRHRARRHVAETGEHKPSDADPSGFLSTAPTASPCPRRPRGPLPAAGDKHVALCRASLRNPPIIDFGVANATRLRMVEYVADITRCNSNDLDARQCCRASRAGCCSYLRPTNTRAVKIIEND